MAALRHGDDMRMPAEADPEKRKPLKKLSPETLADMRALDDFERDDDGELYEGVPRRELVHIGGGKMGRG